MRCHGLCYENGIYKSFIYSSKSRELIYLFLMISLFLQFSEASRVCSLL